ncbi:GATA-N domain-containing protein [Heracleum sosnowskyi]|uniref:GATA-N domain-containing protein n=1 Tax=Heracleum sosnowskyi TaxID=360622 RepID=A0AAD8HHS7_9APIA|nr:GATA-N domain-containing protein [Heracleum sosnowskyi]
MGVTVRGGGVLVASTPLQNHSNSFLVVGRPSGLATPKEACYNYIRHTRSAPKLMLVSAKKNEEEAETNESKRKQNLFESVTEALDFAQVRSEEDAQLLDDARKATKSGSKMTREQYGALRRKIGGTYKDFFKSYVDVDGEYVEEGWVDKTCKICKKDTRGEARQVDNFGRYVHTACLDDKSKSGTNNSNQNIVTFNKVVF